VPQGPPLLLLHHAAGAASDWTEIIDRLGPAVRLVAPDLPEHGKNGARRLPTIEAMAAFAAGSLAERGISRAVVAGHSMGGAVALQLALDWPERVAGLVLLSTSARLRVAQALLALIRERFLDFPQQMLAMGFSPSADPAVVRRWVEAPWPVTSEAALADFLACDRFDVRGRLPEIRVPTVVVVGEDDGMTPVKLSRAMVGGIPGARLRLLPATGHFSLWERPGEVVEELRAIRAAVGGGSGS
jgi:pimeloyl-ACP methyl ester carboxylesterase